MKNKKFEIKVYYTGFCSYRVKAENESEAVKKARKLNVNDNEILNNLEGWEEADTAEEIK